MKPRSLSLRDQKTFSQYLDLSRHELAVYAFLNIYIWKDFFDIRWTVIEDSLCIFFRDKIAAFLYLEPLAKHPQQRVLNTAFAMMNKANSNPEFSRIENAEACNLEFYRHAGYRCMQKSSDFICARKNLARLSGDNFKSKRASCNYFIKHNHFEFVPYDPEDKINCLKLYDLWAGERRRINQDVLYQGMLEDSRKSLEVLLNDYRDLNCIGRIVKIDGQIRALTFGFKLNTETFCILYEITDLSIKGLAQFIFREFCSEMSDYKYINIMDDSGLENLKKVKLSYHPVKLTPAYIIKR